MTTVNVLEVLDRLLNYLWNPFEPENQSDKWIQLKEARAAVAELIEAGAVAANLIHAMIEALDDPELGDGDSKVLDRLNNALSRIGGEP